MTQKDWGKKIGENRGVGVGEAWKEYKDRNEENTLRKSVCDLLNHLIVMVMVILIYVILQT